LYLIVWEFQVQPGSERRFEIMYGPNGAWVSLFSRDPDWVSTELLQDTQNAGRYLTVDRWRSAQAYERFLEARGVRYEQIDRAGEGITVTERLIGRFESEWADGEYPPSGNR
jgi:heme-degrading monooxygenase HmoA